MRMAAALAADGQTIVPLSDGPVLAILDTESLKEERFDNPGYPLTRDRRATATEFLHSQRVDLVCAVPQTFCRVSHDLARSHRMRFVQLAGGTTWDDVVAGRLWAGEGVTEDIPNDSLFPGSPQFGKRSTRPGTPEQPPERG